MNRLGHGALCAVTLAALALPAVARAGTAPERQPLSDPELAQITGKFVLPNGAEIALSVTSDTVLNGQLVLRTVFKVDTTATVQAFGRTGAATDRIYSAENASNAVLTPTGVSVAFDRQSGTSTVTPTFSIAPAAVHVGAATEDDPATWGLAQLPVAPGGAAVATPDGLVTLTSLGSRTLVTLAGDQFTTSHLVGDAIATAITNSANDRVIDTVTNVNIDLRDVATLTAGSAALRVDSLALDAARGMVR